MLITAMGIDGIKKSTEEWLDIDSKRSIGSDCCVNGTAVDG